MTRRYRKNTNTNFKRIGILLFLSLFVITIYKYGIKNINNNNWNDERNSIGYHEKTFDSKDKIIVHQQHEINRLNTLIRSLKQDLPQLDDNNNNHRRLLIKNEPTSKNETCEKEEKLSQETIINEIKITLYSAIIILFGIVAVSICFERTEEVARENTKDNFKQLLQNVFSELTVLGFIGLLMFVITKFGKESLNELAGNPKNGLFKHDCFEHCGELICPENPFIELTETVHMILFGTMLIFLGNTAITYYYGTKIFNKVSQWEQYCLAHTAENAKKLTIDAKRCKDEAYGNSIFDFICRCKCINWREKNLEYTAQLQRYKYMAIRKSFIACTNSKLTAKTKQHQLTAHFNFSLYLQYALGEQISAMVEISADNWLVLFLILSTILLINVIIAESEHRQVLMTILIVALGYISTLLTYLVKLKLKGIEAAVMPYSLGSIDNNFKTSRVRNNNTMNRPLLGKKLSRRLSIRLTESDFLSEMKLDEHGNPVLAHLNANDFVYEPNYKMKNNGIFDDDVEYETTFKICCNCTFSKERIIAYLRVTQVLHALYFGIFFILILPNMLSYWEKQHKGHESDEDVDDFNNIWNVVSFAILYIIPLIGQTYGLETILLHIIYVGNVESLTVEKNVAQTLRVMKSKRALQVLHNISCFMSYMDDVGKECQKTFMKIPLLDGLDEEHVKAIMLSCEPAVFRKGASIIKQNEKNPRGLYIICSGQCDVFINKMKVNSIGIGEYFGEVTLITGGGATASVTASDLCICMLLDRDTLMNLCPSLFREFVERKKTLKRTDTQIILRQMAYQKHQNIDSMRDILTLKRMPHPVNPASQITNEKNLILQGPLQNIQEEDIGSKVQKSTPTPLRKKRRRSTHFGWYEEPGGIRYLKGSVMEIKKEKSIDSAIQFNRRLALLDTFNLINSKDDTIEEDELVSFLINLFPKESSLSAFYRLQITLMIKTIDLDGDDTIDKYEWFE